MLTFSRASPTATVNSGIFSRAARSLSILKADSEPRLLRPSLKTMTPCTMFEVSRFTSAVNESGTLVPRTIARATSIRFSILARFSFSVALSTSANSTGTASSSGDLLQAIAQSALPASLAFQFTDFITASCPAGETPRNTHGLKS